MTEHTINLDGALGYAYSDQPTSGYTRLATTIPTTRSATLANPCFPPCVRGYVRSALMT
jgi:hypothetical protein